MPQRYQQPCKSLLRQACADLFPGGYLSRPKQGIALPMATWMRGRAVAGALSGEA
jgi:hypothetical protein